MGITAFSHHAIDNFLEEIVKVLGGEDELRLLHAVRRGSKPARGASNNPPCARSEFNLVAGTTWLFASGDMRDAQSTSCSLTKRGS